MKKTYRELNDYMDDLKDRLRTIESVGTMSVSGMQTEQIAVCLDPEKLQHYAISEKTVGSYSSGTGLSDHRRLSPQR